ncbi:phosphotransferase family protein [Gordonia sp. zg691]|uniref:phosphotransferase family protein n=1 Tax=Gordonia jinghuaiqii TaxID=2758710 RepID=UPI00166233DD|nr:phosphotransferase family protein [Gordonia jinghuaiqii]MBD0863560.1 phosphotransferase family protein [Gordonia jinghuaiqii]
MTAAEVTEKSPEKKSTEPTKRTPKGLPDELRAWIVEVTGAQDITAKQVPGGASRQAWFVDAHGVTGGSLFLRYDPREPKPGSAFHPLSMEAEIMAALNDAGACVPRVVASHPSLQAVLLERVGGETWFYLITDPDEQVVVARDFITKLAAIHRLDPRDLAIASFGPVKSVTEHLDDELAGIRARMERKSAPAPLLAFCVDWLERNKPTYDGPPVLVQGDTGPGNFMYADGEVTAIVDWELAHLGDPMDDIAWLSLRSAQDPFTHFPDRLAEYEELTGTTIDVQRVWYYRLLAEAKMTTFHGGADDRRGALVVGSPDAGNNLIYGMFHRRLLIEALGHAAGLDMARLDFAPRPGDAANQHVFEATLEVLRAAARQAGDPLAARWTKGAARLVKYLKECDRVGDDLDSDERAELAALLGDEPESIEAGRAELARRTIDGTVDVGDYVAQMWRSVQRDDYLMRVASGALYERTWPPLTDEHRSHPENRAREQQ